MDGKTLITLSPFYHSAVNAVTEPNRLVFCSRYLIQRWSPLLGGTGLQILLLLRSHCFHDRTTGECRNTWQVSRGEIAAAVGVSEATVKRELSSNESLRRFVQPQQEYRLDGGRGGMRRDANTYLIAMDDPVHELDWPRVEAYVREAEEREKNAAPDPTREAEEAKRRARRFEADGETDLAPGQFDPTLTALGQIDPALISPPSQEKLPLEDDILRRVNLTRASGQIDPTLKIEGYLSKDTLITLNVVEEGRKAPFLSRQEAAPVDQVIALTGDVKSRQRYRQLAGIVGAAGRGDLWQAAFKATEARLQKSSAPVENPGAYFCGTLAKLLCAAGVYVPVGTPDERQDVRVQIAASLFGTEGEGLV